MTSTYFNLPKTADNVPIIPGMKVWSKNGVEWTIQQVNKRYFTLMKLDIGTRIKTSYSPKDFYSKNPYRDDSKIIDNLLKTADNVPIIPEMKVWSKNGVEWIVSEISKKYFNLRRRNPDNPSLKFLVKQSYMPCNYYSKNPRKYITADGVPIVLGMEVWTKNGVAWKVYKMNEKDVVLCKYPLSFPIGISISLLPNECYNKNPKKHTLDSFPESFFYGGGVKRPTSIYQALNSMTSEDWYEMIDDLFSDNDKFTICDIIDKIKKTNTCSGTDFPIEV